MHLQIDYKRLWVRSFIYTFLVVTLLSMSCGQGVLAWTTLLTLNPDGAGGQQQFQRLDINNIIAFQNNVTRITWAGNAYSSTLSNTAEFKLRDVGTGTIYGNVSITRTASSVNNYSASATLDITILDFTAKSKTGRAQFDMVYRVGDAYEWIYYYDFRSDCDTHNLPTLSSDPNAVAIWSYNSNTPMEGTWTIYGGTEAPDPPVITNFTVEKSCYNPNESAILHADVTGTVDTWNWKVYDLEGNVISETSDPVDTVTDPLNVIGSLAAKVTVTNEGGTDDDYRTGFINVTQPGECNFTPYNPFPTISTTPTQNVFVTMTMPPSVLVNMTGVNDIINNSYLGNMSAGYRSYVDQIGEGANTTFVGVVTIVQSPLTMIVNGIAEGVSLFSVSINSLMSYTTVPLAIVGITLSYYPWQIITLITAGIAIDAAFVLIFGVR